jgi:hypothetical protein
MAPVAASLVEHGAETLPGRIDVLVELSTCVQIVEEKPLA